LNNLTFSAEQVKAFCGRVDAADARGICDLAYKDQDIRLFGMLVAVVLD